MKLNIILITLVTALAAASVHAQSEADAAAQSENRRPGAMVEQAYKSGDTEALDSNIDDAIVLVKRRQLRRDQGRVSGQRQLVQVAAQCAATAGSAGIAGRPCVRKCGDSNRSYEGEGHRERQVLSPARAVRRHLAEEGWRLGLRRHERYACPVLEASSARRVHQRDASHSSRNHR